MASGGAASVNAEGTRALKEKEPGRVKSATTGNTQLPIVDGVGSLRLSNARPPLKNQTTIPLSPTSQIGTSSQIKPFSLGQELLRYSALKIFPRWLKNAASGPREGGGSGSGNGSAPASGGEREKSGGTAGSSGSHLRPSKGHVKSASISAGGGRAESGATTPVNTSATAATASSSAATVQAHESLPADTVARPR
ncbi:unnamed protein product [Notodromas monacha]|uniref:Uncharacterized protein n=1 Tax=Notodromas monacha TaxID=399045 RepID=A0A7R9GA90_9CRUS|nr:unnamed protein product [Notodromas monacha]CAG0913445.1 unnamed protein product [Notodromas monacha]